VLLLALAIYRYGTRNLHVLLPVFLFLLFAIPLPYVLESALTWRLQGLSAAIGSRLIAAFDIPVYLDGNILELSQHRLQVAEACSGLNYLYPLIGLGVVLATFAPHKSPWSRAIIVLSAVPIAILMNGLRIGISGILVDRFGKEVEQGFWPSCSPTRPFATRHRSRPSASPSIPSRRASPSGGSMRAGTA